MGSPGHVHRGTRRAFVVSGGKPVTSAEVFAWAYPRATSWEVKHRVHIHLAAKALGLKAVRLRDTKTGRFTGAVWYVPDPDADEPTPTLRALRDRARRKLKRLGFRPVWLQDPVTRHFTGAVEWRKPDAGE